MGSVEFKPVVGGIPGHPVVFHDVLHVPELGSNLLSLFHLSHKKGYKIAIEGDKVLFHHRPELHFTATVNNHNVGYLDGCIIVPQSQSAHLVSICPLDYTLWHRRCSHMNFGDLEHMYKNKLVMGMMIKSQSIPPDPICEPCIFEKQHRHNIPKTASHKSHILDLVHKDLKGPMPVQTAEGEHYWELFIDDTSRWKIVAFLRQKSDALVAFKLYKAEAEKQERKFCLPGMTREVNLLAMNISRISTL
jgi:hypothetical protein